MCFSNQQLRLNISLTIAIDNTTHRYSKPTKGLGLNMTKFWATKFNRKILGKDFFRYLHCELIVKNMQSKEH